MKSWLGGESTDELGDEAEKKEDDGGCVQLRLPMGTSGSAAGARLAATAMRHASERSVCSQLDEKTGSEESLIQKMK